MKRLITINEEEIFERLDWARICRAIRESDGELKNQRVRDLANALGWTSWPATGVYSEKLLADYCECSPSEYKERIRGFGGTKVDVLRDVFVNAFLEIKKEFPPMKGGDSVAGNDAGDEGHEATEGEDDSEVFNSDLYVDSVHEFTDGEMRELPWRKIRETVSGNKISERRMFFLAGQLGLNWPAGGRFSQKTLADYCLRNPWEYGNESRFGKEKLKMLVAVLLNAYGFVTSQRTNLKDFSWDENAALKEIFRLAFQKYSLAETEVDILKKRFCLFERENELSMTLEEIGNGSVTRQRIRQIESAALEKLRMDADFIGFLKSVLARDIETVRQEVVQDIRVVGTPGISRTTESPTDFLINLPYHKFAVKLCYECGRDFLDEYFSPTEDSWDFSKVKTDAGSGDGVAEEDAEPGVPVADAPEDAADVPAEETPATEGEALGTGGGVPAAETPAPEAVSEKPVASVAEPPPLPASPKKGWLGKLLSIFRRND